MGGGHIDSDTDLLKLIDQFPTKQNPRTQPPVTPSTKVVKHAGKVPAIHGSAFVAPTASVIGEVTVGKGSSVWYGATLRGACVCVRSQSHDLHFRSAGAALSSPLDLTSPSDLLTCQSPAPVQAT